MPRTTRTHQDPNIVKNVNAFMKRASICDTSRKGYNSNLNMMFQHMIDFKELFQDYILSGDEDDNYDDHLQCYFPIGAERSAQIRIVNPLPLNLLIEHENSIMMFIATDTSKVKRNIVAIEDDFQGMVIGDNVEIEHDDDDDGSVDDVPIVMERRHAVAAADDDDDNNHDDILLPTTDETLIDVLRNQPTISAGGLQGYKSALKKYYVENSIVLERNIDQELDHFIKNYKRLIADKKARGIMNIHEGKSEISFSGYISLADGLRKTKPDGVKGSLSDSMMAWPYFVISWNLMCRPNNVASLMLENVIGKMMHY